MLTCLRNVLVTWEFLTLGKFSNLGMFSHFGNALLSWECSPTYRILSCLGNCSPILGVLTPWESSPALRYLKKNQNLKIWLLQNCIHLSIYDTCFPPILMSISSAFHIPTPCLKKDLNSCLCIPFTDAGRPTEFLQHLGLW